MALAGIEGSVGGDLQLRRDLVEQLGQHGGVIETAGGELSPQISKVFSSIPAWILRQPQRLAPPCLRHRRAEGHAKQNLHRQTGLNGGVEPDSQRPRRLSA